MDIHPHYFSRTILIILIHWKIGNYSNILELLHFDLANSNERRNKYHKVN